MLKKLRVLFIAWVILSMLIVPVSANEGRGLRAELYDFAYMEYENDDIGAGIDAGMDAGRDFFGEGRLVGEVPFTVSNLTMHGSDMDWWTEEMMPEDREPAYHDFFGLKIYGYLVPAETGAYNLRGNIDNAYRLWIDGDLWFDCWQGGYWTDQTGEWPESLKAVQLEAGKVYEIYAEFIENWGGQQVILEWAINDGNFASIPDGVFYRTAEAAATAAEAVLNPPPPAEENPTEAAVPAATEAPAANEPDNAADTGENNVQENTQQAANNQSNDSDDGNALVIIIIIAGAVVAIIIIFIVIKKKQG